MKIVLNENQLNKLLEVIGSFSDGQTDLFMTTQDEIDNFTNDANIKLEKILVEVEKECGWAHDYDKDIDKGGCVIHKCYPMGYFYTNKPVYRSEFVKRLSERIPKKYLNTSYPMTAIRPEDWYVDVTIKKL